MSPERTCPDCGSTLPADAPRGLCPQCLMGAALSRRSAGESEATGVFELGILDTIALSIGPVPRVLLRDTAPGEPPGPVVRPDGHPADRSTHYRIDGEIARGGMGSILKGRDSDLGREVAIKVLRDDFRDDATMVRRFVEEAQIGGQLQHPGIVPIYELSTFVDRRPFFSMKLVKGHTWAQLLAARPDPAAELPRFLSIFEAVCQTMAYAHARGVIHRDLKPSNVMVGSFGEVQVMDWGLAKVLPSGGNVDDAAAGKVREETLIATARSGDDSDVERSHAGSVMGTPSYMAPEQARGEIDRVDERADVFALGSILAEVLTGSPAFTGRSSGEIQRKATLGDTTEALARLDAIGADADLITLAKDCMAREREDRPRGASAVAERMTAYLAGVQERMRRAELTSVEERDRRRLTTVVAASLLLLSITGGLGFTYWQQQRQAGAARIALALKEATLLRDQAVANPDDLARWPAALESLKRAENALADGGDPAVRKQLAILSTEVQAEAEAAERDRMLMAKLIDIRSAKADGPVGSTIDAAYASAFREAGIDVEMLEPAAAGNRIGARPEPVRLSLVAALDHWTGVRRARASQGEPWPRLVAVARAADPDPDRDALRAALAVEDKSQRLEQVRPLAERADAQTWAPASLVLLASVLAGAGDFDDGVRVLRRASGVHPTDIWVHFALGSLLEKTTPPRLEEAIEAYSAARALQPETAHELAHALERNGRSEEAEAIFRDLVGRRPDMALHLECLGNHLKGRGRDDEAGPFLVRAIAAGRKAIELDPNAAVSHSQMSIALNARGQLDEAIASSRKAIELQPNFATAHINLGIALAGKGRLDDAINSFRKAIELQPNFAAAHIDLGNALAGKGRLDDAIDSYHKAIELAPKFAQTHSNLGHALVAKGRLDEAIASHRKAIELDAKVAASHSDLGIALYLKGQPEEAVASFRKAVELDPRHASFRTDLAQAQRQLAVRDKLPAFLNGDFQPTTNDERLGLARWCSIQKRHRAAAHLYAAAFAVDPKPADDLRVCYHYNAACHASLAAAGQGEDAAQLDDAEKARLRKQALDWLHADLTLRSQRLENGSPDDRMSVLAITLHSKQDPDLASLRDPDALAKLPEAERREWRAFWGEVEALLERIQGQGP